MQRYPETYIQRVRSLRRRQGHKKVQIVDPQGLSLGYNEIRGGREKDAGMVTAVEVGPAVRTASVFCPLFAGIGCLDNLRLGGREESLGVLDLGMRGRKLSWAMI